MHLSRPVFGIIRRELAGLSEWSERMQPRVKKRIIPYLRKESTMLVIETHREHMWHIIVYARLDASCRFSVASCTTHLPEGERLSSSKRICPE